MFRWHQPHRSGTLWLQVCCLARKPCCFCLAQPSHTPEPNQSETNSVVSKALFLKMGGKTDAGKRKFQFILLDISIPETLAKVLLPTLRKGRQLRGAAKEILVLGIDRIKIHDIRNRQPAAGGPRIPPI